MRYNNVVKIDGKEIAEKMYDALRKRVGEFQKKGIVPHLMVILVGGDPASVAYVGQKQKHGEAIGAKVTVLRYDETVTTEALEAKIKELNTDPSVHAILLQRPVPPHIDIDKLELLTDAQKDIDGFHPDSPFTLPLPLAVVKILEEIYKMKYEARNPKLETNPNNQNTKRFEHSDFDIVSNFDIRISKFSSWLKSQKIIIIGKGPTGGKPVLEYLKKLGIAPEVIDSKTPQPETIIKQADIIICAVGRDNVVKPEMIKPGVILISVGLFRGNDGKLHGDYDEEKIKDIASFYTPTPGGVGPVNVAMLLENLLVATENQTK